MVLNVLMGITAKLSAAGVAAKAGVGLAVAAASVGGAAAVGVLPEVGPPAQPVEEIIVADAPEDEVGEEGAEGDTPEAADHDNFGSSVSEDAADPDDPGVDGRQISELARNQGAAHRPADAGGAGQTNAGETPAADHLPESVPAGPDTADQYRPSPAPGEDVPAGAPDELPAAPEELPEGAPESAPSGGPADAPRGRP